MCGGLFTEKSKTAKRDGLDARAHFSIVRSTIRRGDRGKYSYLVSATTMFVFWVFWGESANRKKVLAMR